MQTIERRPWHDAAMALLTDEWQRQSQLVQSNPGFDPDLAWVLDDLEHMGLAERRVEPVMRGSQQAGTRIYWRKHPNPST